MSENITIDELKEKYSNIIIYNLYVEPHTKWAIVYIPKPEDSLFPFREILIFKDEHGKVLAFWKGPKQHVVLGALEGPQSFVNANPSLNVYDGIIESMKKRGFDEYRKP